MSDADGGPEERHREQAMLAALRALSRRERTVAEMRGHLLGREVEEELVEETIETLIEIGELNDERYATAFAADKRELAGWGPERIAAALAERGVEPALIERCCVEGREEQLARATAQLLRRGAALADERDHASALSYLTRRGYDYELAYDAVRLAARDSATAA